MKNTRFVFDRSEQAFRWSCDSLVNYAMMNSQKLYFWTFTFVKKMPDAFYSYHWKGFIRDVLRLYRDDRPLYGVKVTEPHRRAHPGSVWRGLHYHCVVNHRIPVGEVRRIGKRYGIGRVQVSRVYDVSGVSGYLGKYLRKSFRSSQKLSPGIHRWSCLGGFDGVRVNAIHWDTPTTRACRAVKEIFSRSLTFSEMREVCGSKNIFAPEHLAFCLWYARENIAGLDPLAAFRWSWWELEREMGLPDHPFAGRVPF